MLGKWLTVLSAAKVSSCCWMSSLMGSSTADGNLLLLSSSSSLSPESLPLDSHPFLLNETDKVYQRACQRYEDN